MTGVSLTRLSGCLVLDPRQKSQARIQHDNLTFSVREQEEEGRGKARPVICIELCSVFPSIQEPTQ